MEKGEDFYKSPLPFPVLSTLTLIQLQIVFLDPADAAQKKAERPADNGGQNEADERKADPIQQADRGGVFTAEPAENDADGAKEAAGAHARVDGGTVHLHFKHTRRKRTRDGRSDRRGDPDARIFDDVGHLEHAGAKSLRNKTAPAVFAKAHDGKADHLRAAARYRGTARKCKTKIARADGGKPNGGTNGSGGDGEREGDAHDHRNDQTHDEGLLERCPADKAADIADQRTDIRGNENGKTATDKDRDERGDENIDLCFL